MSTERLYTIVARVFNIPISEINDESSPETIEGWDSLSLYILLEDIESEFKINFKMEEILEIKSVADFKKFLRNHGVEI